MNLWTFVLLGFLARSSNGATEIRSSMLAQELNSKITKKLNNLSGVSVINTFTFPNVNIIDVASVAVDSGYSGSGSLWHYNFSGLISVSGIDILNKWYRFSANGELDFAAENGCPNFIWQPGKSAVSLNVQSPESTSSRSITDSADVVQLLLVSKIEHMCQNGIADMNQEFQRITLPRNYLGNSLIYKIRYIQHLPYSVVLHEDVDVGTVDGVKTYNLYTPSISSSALPAERSYKSYMAAEIYLKVIGETAYQRELTGAEFNAYQIFPDVPGKKQIHVTQPSPAVYDPSDSKLTYKSQLKIYDELGNLLVKLDADLTTWLTLVRGIDGSYWMSTKDLEISETFANFVDSRCNCVNNPIPYIQSLTTSCLTDAFSNMKCQLENPIPDPMPLDFLPKPTCSFEKGVSTCGA